MELCLARVSKQELDDFFRPSKCPFVALAVIANYLYVGTVWAGPFPIGLPDNFGKCCAYVGASELGIDCGYVRHNIASVVKTGAVKQDVGI